MGKGKKKQQQTDDNIKKTKKVKCILYSFVLTFAMFPSLTILLQLSFHTATSKFFTCLPRAFCFLGTLASRILLAMASSPNRTTVQLDMFNSTGAQIHLPALFNLQLIITQFIRSSNSEIWITGWYLQSTWTSSLSPPPLYYIHYLNHGLDLIADTVQF